MIRDRLKEFARKAALRAFKMEWQAEAADPTSQKLDAPPPNIDPMVIPRVVDGSGDTPGPNHRTDIGRTWLAAQVVSRSAPMLIDLRHPTECAGGILPGAIVMPGAQLKSRLGELPDKALRVVVYDQIGSEDGTVLAAWLREEGWGMARRLAGGFAEWIEHGEPVAEVAPPPGCRFAIGTMVRPKSGGDAWVQSAGLVDGKASYLLYTPGGALGPLGEDALEG